jgi:hypothetical protein
MHFSPTCLFSQLIIHTQEAEIRMIAVSSQPGQLVPGARSSNPSMQKKKKKKIFLRSSKCPRCWVGGQFGLDGEAEGPRVSGQQDPAVSQVFVSISSSLETSCFSAKTVSPQHP